MNRLTASAFEFYLSLSRGSPDKHRLSESDSIITKQCFKGQSCIYKRFCLKFPLYCGWGVGLFLAVSRKF